MADSVGINAAANAAIKRVVYTVIVVDSYFVFNNQYHIKHERSEYRND